MRRGRLYGPRGCAIVLSMLLGWAAAAAAQSREYVEYWRTTYQELTPAQDPRAAKAHEIFKRLVQVAGKRPDVVPQLLITARDPWDIALPIALRDGWIVLSKGALDLCYQDPARGDDRLAFVLAHEIAHQLNDDLWHVRFAQAFEAFKSPRGLQQPELHKVWEEVQRITGDVERVRDRELRADERGLIYAAIAGFNPHVIVAQGPQGNFFDAWVRGLELNRIPGLRHVRPTPQERAEASRAHLRWMADNTSLFHLGLWSYYAGDYPRAIQAFDAFRSVFPSREVFHNLAVSHHQLALQAYRKWHPEAQPFPFQLSLAIEPLTRASTTYLERTRGKTGAPAEVFRQHLEQAIRWYEEALSQDGQYTPAALNLGAALILRGAEAHKAGPHPDVADAVARLSRALQHTPQSPALLNNLGVAWFHEKHPAHAKEMLTRAQTLAPTYAAPVFNLGAIAHLEHQAGEAQRYMHLYRQLAAPPAPALPPGSSPEIVHGVTIGQMQSHLPTSWGAPTRSTVALDGKPWTVATYPAGVMALLRDGEIVMLMVREGHQGRSTRGIALGSREADVLASYGPPSRRHEMTLGQNWAYDRQRIAFQLRAGQVVSWLVF